METLNIQPVKALLYTTILLFSGGSLMAQNPTENYVNTTTYTAPSTGAITENDTLVSVTYFDGLGRAKQSVAVGAGGAGEDLVTPVVYDGFGRQTREYLPYAAATAGGSIHEDPVLGVEAFYNIPKYENTLNPYSEKVLEASPLSRVLEQGAPGADWQADTLSDSDHTIKFEYGTNAEDEVRLFKVSTLADTYASGLTTYEPSLQEEGFYAPGRLYKTTTKDENWQPGDGQLHTTEEFKDFQGRVVLKRTFVASPPSGQGC